MRHDKPAAGPITAETQADPHPASAYLNNRIEQDHLAIKQRVRLMMGFKPMSSARTILGGIEMVYMMRKGQAKYACAQQLSLAEQFERLAA
jgi:putative transposase